MAGDDHDDGMQIPGVAIDLLRLIDGHTILDGCPRCSGPVTMYCPTGSTAPEVGHYTRACDVDRTLLLALVVPPMLHHAAIADLTNLAEQLALDVDVEADLRAHITTQEHKSQTPVAGADEIVKAHALLRVGYRMQALTRGNAAGTDP